MVERRDNTGKQPLQPDGPITYSSTGVNYDAMDPLKRLAQLRARATSKNLNRFGMKEIEASRGESAYVWEEQDSYRAFVIEGLGTKNRVADETRKITALTCAGKIKPSQRSSAALYTLKCCARNGRIIARTIVAIKVMTN